jgi:hypothetical protein
MVSKCANPECAAPFRRMRSGKLIRAENRPNAENHAVEFAEYSIRRRTEFFWLCGECSSKGLTLQKDGSIAEPRAFAAAAGTTL